jgi:hypothetical protein
MKGARLASDVPSLGSPAKDIKYLKPGYLSLSLRHRVLPQTHPKTRPTVLPIFHRRRALGGRKMCPQGLGL